MTEHIALLGRVNVAGNTVAMARLRDLVAELGHADVGSYLQTGNVFFRGTSDDPDALAAELSAHLGRELGFAVPAVVTTVAELGAALEPDPFTAVAVDADTRLMVLALDRAPEPSAVAALPLRDDGKGFTLLEVRGRHALAVLRLIDGRPGNIAPWVERQLGVRATGRFAHTTAKILAAAEAHFATA